MVMPGIKPRTQQWQARVLPLHYPGPNLHMCNAFINKNEKEFTSKCSITERCMQLLQQLFLCVSSSFCCWHKMSHLVTKPTKWLCAQRRLRSAWASVQSDQSSLCGKWVAKDPSFLHVDSDDSDQTGRMPKLIWVFTGCTCYFVGFVVRRLKCHRTKLEKLINCYNDG